MGKREAIITGTVEGKMTEELKRKYAKTLARLLIEEKGREECKRILGGLKKS